jgi:hypothetical protein
MSPADMEPLAAIAQEVAGEWGLELGRPFVLSNYSSVAPAGDDIVLKVTPRADDEADEEPDALALWGGDGAVRPTRDVVADPAEGLRSRPPQPLRDADGGRRGLVPREGREICSRAGPFEQERAARAVVAQQSTRPSIATRTGAT